jgi:hypothetical protein
VPSAPFQARGTKEIGELSVSILSGATVTVRATGDRFVSEFSPLPGRTFGPWDLPEMIQDLTISALLTPLQAREVVMDAAVLGEATTEMNY